MALFLTEADVRALLTMPDLIAAMETVQLIEDDVPVGARHRVALVGRPLWEEGTLLLSKRRGP